MIRLHTGERGGRQRANLVNNLSGWNIDKVPPAAFGGMKPTDVAKLPPDAFSAMNPNQVGALPPAHLNTAFQLMGVSLTPPGNARMPALRSAARAYT
ncbi:MAG: hypothetical protein EB054_06260, partial [Actinobacteria bacterium]|nr:hypothetical protein [Actinomycetota bacterium]